MERQCEPGEDMELAAAGHLTLGFLDAYFAGRCSTLDLLARALPHLDATCSGREDQPDLPQGEAFAAAIQRARERTAASQAELAAEHSALPAALSALLAAGPANAHLRVAEDSRLRTLAFTQHELDVAAGALHAGRPALAGHALALARQALSALDPDRYGPATLRSFAAEHLGLAARLRVLGPGAPGDAGPAEGASLLAAAEALWPHSGREADLSVELLRSAAALARGEGDLARAVELLDRGARRAPAGDLRSAATAEAAALERLLGRASWGAGRLARVADDEGGDLPACDEAERVRCLAACARLAEADEALGRLERRVGGTSAGILLLRGIALGRAASAADAEAALTAAQVEYLAAGDGLGAATAVVERARLYRREGAAGRRGALRDLARDVPALAACEDLDAGCLAALSRFAGAAAGNDVGEPGLVALEERLTRCRRGLTMGLESDAP